MQIHFDERLNDFAQRHPNSKPGLHRWRDLVRQRDFQSLNEVREVFPHADMVRKEGFLPFQPGSRGQRTKITKFTVFNIGGNKTRLITRILYDKHQVVVHLVLTHAEYNAWLKRR